MTDFYLDNVLRERWDDVARVYTAWDENGVQIEQRPYTAEENAQADVRQEQINQDAEQKARVAESQAIISAIAATAVPPPSGSAWVQPTGAHDAYALNSTVTHNGKTWTSLIAYNTYEPGVSSWREDAAPGELPDWVQPTGGHDAYPLGAQVKHNGSNWESDIADNVWEPGVFGWTVIP